MPLSDFFRRVPLIRCIALMPVGLQIGCGATVIPPPFPRQPTQVFICDYGVHSSLLLPLKPAPGQRCDTYVEYLYGDWNWAALDHTQWYDAIGAMLFSTQATLGRRFITVPTGRSRPVPDPPPKNETGLIVDGIGCLAVMKQLDSRWQSHQGTATVASPEGGYFAYVKDDEPYHLLHNCNHQTADCLRQMGCKIHGAPLLSDFTVTDPK